MPVIASVGTATPPYCVSQQDTRSFARNFFYDSFQDLDRLLAIFASAEIDKRYFCVPAEWFGKPHGWKEKNALYLENAVWLGATAIKNCLKRADLTPEDVDALIFVSSTGLSTPSIDAYLLNLLAMRKDLLRLPVWGLGCGGGVAGLARSFDLVRADARRKVLVCCVELCGLTFVYSDRSKGNLVATSLFADGAAAVLVTGDEAAGQFKGPQITACRATTFQDTLDIMGWDIQDEGLMVIFSKDIPSFVQKFVSPCIDDFLNSNGLKRSDIGRYIVHPGGMKVIKAYEESLALKSGSLEHSRQILRSHGNMSSCTVLYVLEKELQNDHQSDEIGLMTALGPGFSCEQVLLQW